MRILKEKQASTDGLLQLGVSVEEQSGELTIGFLAPGYSQPTFFGHTHDDILASRFNLPTDQAITKYITLILKDKSVITVIRRGSEIANVYLSDRPGEELKYLAEGEECEFRYWSGRTFEG